MRRFALLVTFLMGCVTAFWVGQVHRRVSQAFLALKARGELGHAWALFASPSNDLWSMPCRSGCLSFASSGDVEPRLITTSGEPLPSTSEQLRTEFLVADAGVIPVILSWRPLTFDPGATLSWSACDWDDPEPPERATERTKGDRVQLRLTLHADTDEPFLSR